MSFKGSQVVIKIMAYTQKKYQDHISYCFVYKVVCIDNKFTKKIVLYRGKSTVYRFIEAILEEYDYCKKTIKNHFNKNPYYVCSR